MACWLGREVGGGVAGSLHGVEEGGSRRGRSAGSFLS